MADSGHIDVGAGGKEEVNADASLDHFPGYLTPCGVLSLEQCFLFVGVVYLRVLAEKKAAGAPGGEGSEGANDFTAGFLKSGKSCSKGREKSGFRILNVEEELGEGSEEGFNNSSINGIISFCTRNQYEVMYLDS